MSLCGTLWRPIVPLLLTLKWYQWSSEVSITPPLSLPVHPVTGRCGARLSGPGPPVPALLFHLSVLPAEQKWGPAQRWLLLHSLVCHHRNTCLQVSINTGSEWWGFNPKHSYMSFSFNTGPWFPLSWPYFRIPSDKLVQLSESMYLNSSWCFECFGLITCVQPQ